MRIKYSGFHVGEVQTRGALLNVGMILGQASPGRGGSRTALTKFIHPITNTDKGLKPLVPGEKMYLT
jgi:hypothetical protein